MTEDRPPLQDAEVLALARQAICSAREDTTRRTEADADGVAKDLQQPGITIDLGHHGIRRLPEEVIDIIKGDIERLALSHNQFTTLPVRLAECARLRYLNVRYNALREFPQAILQLPTLEILDVSKNKIREIPDAIANLTSLKVLAIQRNRIERLPVCLGDISSLHMLKLDGNPISFPPSDVCSIKERAPAPAGDNERDALITTQVKRYLRQIATRERLKVESEGDSSESNVETPRPVRSRGGGRFPVKPSISSLDAFADLKQKSESPNDAPPIPARSHYRVQSQQNATTRRPPVAPLIINNERNRSHSEGAGSATMRAKRMGMVTRKASELAPVNESRSNGSNHSRGFSHGHRMPSIRPLSDLVEHKPWSGDYDDVVQSCRITAESTLDYLNPTERLLRRTTLPGQHALMSHFHRTRATAYALSELLERYDALTEDQEDEADHLFDKLLEEGEACIEALTDLEILMHDSEEDLGKGIDHPGVRRAWRAQINAQYMGAVEARNACEILGIAFAEPPGPKPRPDPRNARSSTTPTQNMPHPDQRLVASQAMGFNTNGNTNGTYGLTPPMRTTSRSNTLTSVSSAATPRSGESFATLGSVSMSRSNTMQTMEDVDEERVFERIWQKLNFACTFTLNNLPICHERFEHACLRARADQERGHIVHPRWMRVLERSTQAHQAAMSLNEDLGSIKLRDAEFRGSQRFWELCTSWVKAWSDLAVAVKEVGQLGQLPEDIKQVMKPVQKAVKDASISITTSPWSHLAVRNDSTSVFSTQTSFRSYNRHLGHGMGSTPSSTSSVVPGLINTSISTISSLSNYTYGTTTPAGGSMGHITPVPATPLSAALGAAAQATVPSTPGHVPMLVDPPMTGRFAGNVFERADRLLQQTQRRV